MHRSSPQQRDAQAKAYVARATLAAEWAQAMRVLLAEADGVDAEVHRTLIECAPSIAAEREALDRARDNHQRELHSSMRVVRANPTRLHKRADESNDGALQELERMAKALDSVNAEADELLAAAAAAATKSRSIASRAAPGQQRAVKRPGSADAPRGSVPRGGASPPGVAIPAASASKPSSSSHHGAVDPFAADAAALDDFLRTHGGASLGWPDRAHAAFQRALGSLRSEDLHKPGTQGSAALLQPAVDAHATRAAIASVLDVFNDDAIAEVVVPRLQGHVLDTGAEPEHRDVAHHLVLYREYLARVERRRVSVAAWKDARRVESLQADRIEELQRQRRTDAAATSAARKEQQRLARHHETSEKVRRWKEEREQQAKEAAMLEAERRRQQDHAAVLRQRMHGAALNAKVEAHHDAVRRQREVQMLGRAAVHHEAIATTNAALKNRRDQDAAIVAKRREAIEARSAKQRPSSADPGLRPRSSSTSNASHRDPSRLCAPTASSAARSSSSDARVQMTRGPAYLTPRHNHNIRTPAAWCGFQHMR